MDSVVSDRGIEPKITSETKLLTMKKSSDELRRVASEYDPVIASILSTTDDENKKWILNYYAELEENYLQSTSDVINGIGFDLEGNFIETQYIPPNARIVLLSKLIA